MRQLREAEVIVQLVCPQPAGDGFILTEGAVLVQEAELGRRGRMAGRGRMRGNPGGFFDPVLTATYVSNVNCDKARGSGPSFKVRFANQRFRLTRIDRVRCSDTLAGTTPPAGFDTQTGSGTGTLDGMPGAKLQWTLTDGGPGDSRDTVALRVSNPGGAAAFQGSAAPPGSFPGSGRTFGSNRALPRRRG